MKRGDNMIKEVFRKGLVLGIIILFVGASVLPSMSGNIGKINVVKDIKESNAGMIGATFYVDDDSACPGDGSIEWPYCKIQYAIDNASDGDTIIVFNGTYYENVVVNKSLDLIGENRDTTIIDGGEIGIVVNISADSVNISEFTIQNSGTYDFDAGIGIYSSNHNTITGNNISGNNWFGIEIVYDSSYNNITGNNISGNIYCILIVYSSNHNTITGNNISGNWSGINIVYDSSYNNITGNNISDNKMGIGIGYSSNHNTITGNNISGSNNHGIYIDIYCNKNIIYLNNFIENSVNAWDWGANQWDNGSIGNYWDDYRGKDSNGDGIGDIPYWISPYITGNKDSYPIVREQKPDTTPPEVSINKPSEGYLYIFNVEICPTHSGETKIYSIGGVDIEVDARDHESGMHHVEFYIDDVKKEDEYYVLDQVTSTWRSGY
jgi:parallel beta-helix repeat protein